MNYLSNRITINESVYNGRPAIRNMRFTVAQMLELVAAGMSFDEILADYSYIEREDISACLNYASMIANNKEMLSFSVERYFNTKNTKDFHKVHKAKFVFPVKILCAPCGKKTYE